MARGILEKGARLLAAISASMMIASCNKSGSDGFPSSPDGPPGDNALLESLPIDVMSLDYAAMAAKAPAFDPEWKPLFDFGYVVPPTSNNPNPKTNPQPTFYAPLGTPVVAIVSGTVTRTPRLYSNDSSVMIASGGGPIWEMEHVIKVRVRVGDHVMAGDTIAEVSNYECAWGRNSVPTDPICASGLGLVEIGLLYGGNPPEHRCPFEPQLVDAAKRGALFAQLDSARARVERALGDTATYNPSGWETPQCISLERVPG
jgi:biotin carboxyl carrier protein